MKKIWMAGVMVLAGCLGVLGAAADTHAVTCPPGSLKAGQDLPSYAECNLDDTGQPDLMDTVTQILNVIVGIIGVLAVAVIIIGAVFFVTSQGLAALISRGYSSVGSLRAVHSLLCLKMCTPLRFR